MVYLSSTSVYAEAGGGWVDETSAVAEEDSRAMAMVTAEKATLGAGGTVVRCAGIYGPGREIGPNAGGPERWLNVIEVEDAARAVGAVLRNGGEIFNVCEDEALARGQKGGVWAEDSVRSRRSKRVRNQKLKEAGWNAIYAGGRIKN
jgi:nucleoside-diphosphate-sugar epimerase